MAKTKPSTKYNFKGKVRRRNETRGRKPGKKLELTQISPSNRAAGSGVKLNMGNNGVSNENEPQAGPSNILNFTEIRGKEISGGKRARPKPLPVSDISQHTADLDGEALSASAININDQPVHFEFDVGLQSASEKKFKLFNIQTDESTSINDTSFLYNMKCFNELISKPLICENCIDEKEQNFFANLGRQNGLSVEINILCSYCNAIIRKQWSQTRIDKQISSRAPFEINRRAVIASREVGLGNVGLNKILGILNVAGSMHHKTFSRINKVMHQTILYTTAVNNLEEAHQLVRQAYLDVNPELAYDEILNISVTYDGSWHKRGHTSLYGVGAVVDMLTGLIIDFDVMSKFCTECELVGNKMNGEEKKKWEELHKYVCDKSYVGSSGSMEVAIAVKLWSRSVDATSFRYTTMLSDGDSKVFKSIEDLNPYGDAFKVMKEECINHVQKRMYSGLDKAAMDARASGKTLGGRGMLTVPRKKRWQSYYRNAILENMGNIENTKNAIWAILLHSVSTPDNPHHMRCNDNWCYFKIAEREGRDPEDVKAEGKHDPTLPPWIVPILKPLFERLTDENLLKKCQQGKTQNINESLHSCIWRKIPKTTFITLKTLQSGAALAICEYNKGATALTDTIIDMGLTPGSEMLKIVKKMDASRLKYAKRQVKESSKEARKLKKMEKARLEEIAKDKEGLTYGAGEF